METILITGGSGLIGQRLSKLLTAQHYNVRHLSRSVSGNEKFETFRWDIEKKYVDPKAIENVDHIIHLAGENVGSGRWTAGRKKRIFSSRIDSANLLYSLFENEHLKSFISASGISYYGSKTTENIYSETDEAGSDFLAKISVDWENAAQQFNAIADRVIALRTGVVLSLQGGALQKLIKPIKMGIGSPIGSGKQYMPWIHLEDMCGIYLKAIQDENINGIYNAVATEHATNAEMTRAIAQQLGKKLWAPKVPAFIIKLLFGEMSIIILEGSRIDNSKIKNEGYHFQFQQLENALNDILKSN